MMDEKLERLKKEIRNMGRLTVAYSGGVDSTFLLKVAHDVLQSNVMAVTIKSATFPSREFNQAIQQAEKIGVGLRVIVFNEMDIEQFNENPIDRCYHCKKAIFTKIIHISTKDGFPYTIEGSNLDDLGDTRPGMKALKELQVASPLMAAGMTKSDVRRLSREMGLSSWDRASAACLASRIPYGQIITREKLKMVEDAEQFLLDLGFKQVRVRHHGEVARIEVPQEEFGKFSIGDLMNRITKRLQSIGFPYVTLDLQGYRTGSLNEVITNG